MGNKLVTLTKILLKNGISLKATGRKRIAGIALVVVLTASFLPIAVNIGGLIFMAYDVLKGAGQEGIILSLGLTMSSFVIFFFGIFYVMNTFYFANDIEILLPLPLKPSQILGAKFINTVIFEYLTELIVVLPIVIAFGIKANGGLLYWLYGAVVFLLLPVIPLALASFIIMLVMRFTNIAKNKDKFRMVGGIAAILIGVSVNTYFQKFAGRGMTPEQLQQMFTAGNNSLVGMTSSVFPSARFAALSMVESNTTGGLLNLIIFLAATAAVFLLFQYIGELLYFKGVIGVSETAAKRKKISREQLDKVNKQNSILKSYFLKEVKILFRTPIYFMNCVLMNFIWPVFIVIPLITQPKIFSGIAKLREYLKDEHLSGLAVAIAFAAVTFIASSNGVASTSISREGQNLFISKYLPVHYKKQIWAKVLSGVLIGAIGMVTLVLAASLILRLPVYLSILMLVIPILGILFTSYTGVLIDLYNPKLNWDNEQKAVKQNLNVVFNMLVGVATAGLPLLGMFKLKLGLWAVAGVLVIIFGILNVLLHNIVASKGVKQFERLEG